MYLLLSVLSLFLIPLCIGLPFALILPVVWFLHVVSAALSQPPFRCSQCGQAANKLTAEQEAEIARQRAEERARQVPLREERARARMAAVQNAAAAIGIAGSSLVRRTDHLLWRMAGGPGNAIVHHFFVVLLAVVPIGGLILGLAIRTSNQRAQVEAANLEVRQAVDNAQRWIRDGSLSDADQIEQTLSAAATNVVATEKESVAPTLNAFAQMKTEREAAATLRCAVDAVADKQFAKARSLLRQYAGNPYAKEQKTAKKLLVEIDSATSDDDALSNLLALNDSSFDSFTKGDMSIVVCSHPALTEARIAILKKNLAEAANQRERKRKIAEAERIAEQKRIQEEKESQQREQLAERRRREEDLQRAEEEEKEIAKRALRAAC
jgi:hypothetical protein